MSNNPAKYEVLIKQYLRSILDISAAKEPEDFKLCFSLEVVAMSCDSVSNCTLYMQVMDESILLLEDSGVMLKGYGREQRYVLTGMLLFLKNIFYQQNIKKK